MLFATMGQGALFLWMTAAGVAIALWYLATAGLRRLMQAGFFITLACDLLFGTGAALILIAFLVAGNYGVFRPFALLGACLGAGISLFGLSLPLKGMEKRLCGAKKRIVTALTQNRLLKFIFK